MYLSTYLSMLPLNLVSVKWSFGELLGDIDKQHGARPADTGLHDVTPSMLSELGINKIQSHRWQSTIGSKLAIQSTKVSNFANGFANQLCDTGYYQTV